MEKLTIDQDLSFKRMEEEYYLQSIERTLELRERNPNRMGRTNENTEKPVTKENKQYLLGLYEDMNNGFTKVKTIRTKDSKLKILRYFLVWLNKDAKLATREDIENYFKQLKCSLTTKEIYKMQLKYFYKWLFKIENDYPPCVKWIKMNRNLKSKSEDYALLTKDEVRLIINSALNLRDKCIIAMLADSGARISELMNVRICDCDFDSVGCCRIKVNGKTGQRRITIYESVPLLKEWLNNHPSKQKDNTDNQRPLFICLGRNYGQPLDSAGAYNKVVEAVRRSGVKKKVTPHIFRHSRLTHLAKAGMNEFELGVFAGWSKRSKMTEIYIHIGEDDVADKLMRMNGIKKEEEKENINNLHPIECWKCKTTNNSDNRFCSNCGIHLNSEDVNIVDNMKEEFSGMLIGNKKLEDEFVNRLKEKIIKELMEKISK